MILHPLVITKQVPGDCKAADPKQITKYTESDKAFVGHTTQPCHERSKSSDNWYKAGDDHCFTSVFFIKYMSLFEILPVNQLPSGFQ